MHIFKKNNKVVFDNIFLVETFINPNPTQASKLNHYKPINPPKSKPKTSHWVALD